MGIRSLLCHHYHFHFNRRPSWWVRQLGEVDRHMSRFVGQRHCSPNSTRFVLIRISSPSMPIRSTVSHHAGSFSQAPVAESLVVLPPVTVECHARVSHLHHRSRRSLLG